MRQYGNYPVTVNGLPSVAGISGASNVCSAATITLTDATTGGTWTSGDAGIAAVGSTGIVTGVSAGTAEISYTYTDGNGCARSTAKTVTVNAAPYVSPITAGIGSVCVGSVLELYDATSGSHNWISANPAKATVNASTGVVTGVASGTTTISYQYTAGCTGYAFTIITVNPLPQPRLPAHRHCALPVALQL